MNIIPYIERSIGHIIHWRISQVILIFLEIRFVKSIDKKKYFLNRHKISNSISS
jgi:hypothetical protein